MTSRRLPALAAPLAALSALAFASTGTAHAAAPSAGPAAGTTGPVQLVVTKVGPIMGDDNDLVYDVHVTNTGSATATGVTVHVTDFECPAAETPVASCTRLPDREAPEKAEAEDIKLDPIAPGATESFPVAVYLSDENAEVARTVVEVVAVDQKDAGSVPGTCADGAHQQADCLVADYALS